jgi:hypothetical protein
MRIIVSYVEGRSQLFRCLIRNNDVPSLVRQIVLMGYVLVATVLCHMKINDSSRDHNCQWICTHSALIVCVHNELAHSPVPYIERIKFIIIV